MARLSRERGTLSSLRAEANRREAQQCALLASRGVAALPAKADAGCFSDSEEGGERALQWQDGGGDVGEEGKGDGKEGHGRGWEEKGEGEVGVEGEGDGQKRKEEGGGEVCEEGEGEGEEVECHRWKDEGDREVGEDVEGQRWKGEGGERGVDWVGEAEREKTHSTGEGKREEDLISICTATVAREGGADVDLAGGVRTHVEGEGGEDSPRGGSSGDGEVRRLEERVFEAERATEQMRDSLGTKAEEVVMLRLALASGKKAAGLAAEASWRTRAQLLEKKLAVSEGRVRQSAVLISKMRSYLGSMSKAGDIPNAYLA
ncbi:MAG: hypothetical protein SGPRY_003062 [Prymnesium sp.]